MITDTTPRSGDDFITVANKTLQAFRDLLPLMAGIVTPPGVFNYFRPGAVDTYRRPGGVSLYKRP